MIVRGARETGIDNIREELYSECFDELIRQITISCMQRGELLNQIKEQMKETINYYQKLYEAAMAFAVRKVLREKKKEKLLLDKEEALKNEISILKSTIASKEQDLEDKQTRFLEDTKDAEEEHKDKVKATTLAINTGTEKIRAILTTPKQIHMIAKNK